MTTLALSINEISIRQDDYSRYCLNDLHKAAGNESRHQPGKFLETQQASELISLLESEESITGIPVILKKQGIGTFVIKEVVYSYAMWISAKFHLAVIRAYDSLVTQSSSNPLQLPFVTKEQREPLVKAIRSLVLTAKAKGRDLSFSDAHKVVNLRLGVEHIDQITTGQLPQALTIVGELLQSMVIEEPVSNFVRPAIESSSNMKDFQLEFSAYYKSFLWNFGESVVMVLEKDNKALLEYAQKFCNPYYPRREIEEIRKQLAIWSKMVDDSELICNAATGHLLAGR